MQKVQIPDNPETIVDRLRGVYPSAVGPYKTSPIQHEAAREIERLREEIKSRPAPYQFDNWLKYT